MSASTDHRCSSARHAFTDQVAAAQLPFHRPPNGAHERRLESVATPTLLALADVGSTSVPLPRPAFIVLMARLAPPPRRPSSQAFTCGG
eukprot:scaffold6362_cov378-Prasinococcus_capsulatus_cf.AAC.10